MGDSITAGFGIRGAAGGLNESRGLSATIGGDPNAITLFNFLQFYSPDVQGASLGQHIVEFCGGAVCPPFQYRPAQDVLNSAQSGAMVSDLVTHELDYLLLELRSNPKINMQEDWKLLTLFIGANDLCSSCTNQSYLQPDEFEVHLTKTLEGIRKNIPRVFVQMVEIMNLSQVYDLSLTNAYCKDIHRIIPFECDCIFDPNANTTRALVDIYGQEYNAKTRAVAAQYQAMNYPDFTVVSQPMGRNTAIKDLPLTFLSTLDCFHPSLIAHQAMAVGLWNNMLTPAASKKTSITISDTPMCPTADTLLYTY
eukprot:Phypoly_transcript_11724.p1 GENE.Phypoly_transcript_11724~~Phypoly_transcript_11724.p1  ORF type:complete len:362 (-),score=46.64 Phypoly_transcript_11724:105-1031(-)